MPSAAFSFASKVKRTYPSAGATGFPSPSAGGIRTSFWYTILIVPISFAFGADISSLYSLLSIVTVSPVVLPSTLNVKPFPALCSSSSSISSDDLMLILPEVLGKSISTSVNSGAVTFGIVPVGKSAGSVIGLP